MTATKIATCCYCGTRATLVLAGKTRHELSCRSCGAPLHDLKKLRSDHDGRTNLVKPSRTRGAPAPRPAPVPRRRKPRKSWKRRLLEEAWDIVEDIFD